jgi:DNA-binding NtrC family response regulator
MASNAQRAVASAIGWSSWDQREADDLEAAAEGPRKHSRHPFDAMLVLRDELLSAGVEWSPWHDPRLPGLRLPITTVRNFGAGRAIVGSEARASCLTTALKAARSGYPLLVGGRTGAGKELVARLYHFGSDRASGAFLPVNVNAITPSLLDAELFGVEGKSATGVGSRRGYFAEADGGTIFLDEIGDIPLDSQVRLLRVLQHGEIQKVGASKFDSINVRVVAATNADLRAAVRRGTFREDLFYRLNCIEVTVPDLATCPEEILPIAHEIADSSDSRRLPKRTFTPTAMAALLGYRWPGNVRELENVVKRALLDSDDMISIRHLKFEPVIEEGGGSVRPGNPFPPDQAALIREMWTQRKGFKEIIGALERNFGVVVPRSTYYNRLKATGLVQLDR